MAHQSQDFDHLADLLACYAQAQVDFDKLTAHRLESQFAAKFWRNSAPVLPSVAALADDEGFDDVPPTSASEFEDIPEHLFGTLCAIQRNVARDLGKDRLSHESAMSWMVWASDENNVAEYWRARARLAEDEANRYLTFLASGTSSTAGESDIPLISRMRKELLDYREPLISRAAELDATGSPEPTAKDHAIIEALFIVERLLMSVRRADLADDLQNFIRDVKHNCSGYAALMRTLMEARILHSHGEIVPAARLCAADLNSCTSSDHISILMLRQNLADYSIETSNFDTARRMLENNLLEAQKNGLILDYFLTLRNLGRCVDLMPQEDGVDASLLRFSETAYTLGQTLPTSALTMDITMVYAQVLLASGNHPRAAHLATEVSDWAAEQNDYARADRALSLLGDCAVAAQDFTAAHEYYLALAKLRTSYPAADTATETLLIAATSLSNNGADPETVDAMMEDARGFSDDPWQEAKWFETKALLRWAEWDNDAAINFSTSAARRFQSAHAPLDAARALSVAVRAAVEKKDLLEAEALVGQMRLLVPENHPLVTDSLALMADS